VRGRAAKKVEIDLENEQPEQEVSAL
jgi:hypothetical protein